MEIEMKYRCNECGDLHDFEEDAHDCCRPTVRFMPQKRQLKCSKPAGHNA